MEFSGTGSHFLTPECPALLLACPGQALHQQNSPELSLPKCRRPHPDAPPGGRVETGMAWAGPSWARGPIWKQFLLIPSLIREVWGQWEDVDTGLGPELGVPCGLPYPMLLHH